MTDKIIIKGARENNLKNIDLELPRDKLIVMTGLSGSGKSSLAFDTIYADGQRRYVESLSSYARMFLGQMEKPDVDSIEGLSPAISIDQKTTSKNPRSTVGTVTEIYDYLRLLYARIGVPHCPVCGRVISQQSIDQMVDSVMELPEGARVQLLAPIVRNRKGQYAKELESARKSGFVRVRIDGIMYELAENIKLDKNKKYPVISNPYPGPQDDQIPRRFTLDDNGNQSLAELGFIVINVQPRGSSPLRGHDFYCFSYGNLRDYPLADDKHTIETLAAKYPFMDLSRVGIYGHSGGGFMAAAAILTYPDFYKVAVAASGNHDNNQYIQWWGETFHGLTKRGGIPTNMELAGNLKGKLMLITGDVDDNVPWVSTLRLANALISKNKRFDMMILPGKDHGVWSPYYQNLIRYYFLENLVCPSYRDMDIINHK